MKPLRIAEIFGPTIQGEGALIGQPTVFVRAGGCDYRCSWCDSMHAVDSAFRDSWAAMQTAEVWAQVRALSGGRPLTVSISGGNPAIQDFGPLIATGRAEGYGFALETQGSVARDWFADLTLLVLSPKPPSKGGRKYQEAWFLHGSRFCRDARRFCRVGCLRDLVCGCKRCFCRFFRCRDASQWRVHRYPKRTVPGIRRGYFACRFVRDQP